MPLLNRTGGGGGEDVSAEVARQKELLDEMETLYKGKTTGADATAEDILEGKKAYVGRNLITGTHPDVTPEVEAQTPIVQEMHDFILGIVGLPTGATAKAENIEKGYTAYVGQQLVKGTLDPESFKNGQYVWEKLSKQSINAKIIPNENSPFSVKVVGVNEDDIVDYSTINLIGVSFDLMLSTGVKSTTIVINDSTTATAGGTSTSNYTFDTSTGIITFANGGWSMGPATYIEPISIPCQGYSFECYVLSDNETEYPEDGENLGYWYRKVVDKTDETPTEEIIASIFGMEKASFGTITLSSDQYPQTYNLVHNLGAIPKMIILFTPEHLYNRNYAIKSTTIIDGYTLYDGYGTNYYFATYMYQDGNSYSKESFSSLDKAMPVSNATESTIPLGDNDLNYLAAGKTYYWIAMA